MQAINARFWDYAYAAILLIAVPVAVFHAAQGRWPQAILVTIAAIVGAAILITGWNQREAPVASARARRPSDEPANSGEGNKVDVEQIRDNAGRYGGWVPMGVVSGFVATGVMTGAVLVSYGASALLASDSSGANQLRIWLANLIDNTVTEMTTVNLAIAIAIHLVAGIVWAIIYAGFAEPRLHGSPTLSGMTFSLLPWLLSITVFFPLIGAGFFAAGIGAGPLPVLGNLILHLVYGAALGKIYASHAIWTEPVSEVSSYNVEVMDLAQRAMAIGLVPGAILGLILSVIATTAFTPETDLLMAAVLGGLVGSAVGIWIGSLTGLAPTPRDG